MYASEKNSFYGPVSFSYGSSIVRLPEQVICGPDGAWVITSVKNDFIYRLSYDTGAAGMEKVAWKPEEGNYSVINVAQRHGVLYAQIQNREENTFEIRSRSTEGVWNDVCSIKADEKDTYGVVGSGFFVDSSGNIFLVNGNLVTRFEGEGERKHTYELKGTVCLFQENSEGYEECVTADTNKIFLYEFIENRAEEKWAFAVSAGQVQGIGSSKEEMLCLAAGTEILFLEKETGSLLARTDLVKLGVGSVLSGYYDADEETLRLYGPAMNGAEGLRCSLLREGEAFAEQRIELVYGVLEEVNAYSESSIMTAINRFNQENEEYYITVRDYGGLQNLDRLHADMASGNGPDIIDMMFSEYYEAYVRNGYLEDLAPYLEQSQYRDDIIWNVLDAYRLDGGLYLMISQFQLNGILIHPEYDVVAEEWNMETFLELIEKNGWEKDIFGMRGNPESLLQCLLSGRQEEYIDWEQETAAFETEEFMDMLALCREYAGRPGRLRRNRHLRSSKGTAYAWKPSLSTS